VARVRRRSRCGRTGGKSVPWEDMLEEPCVRDRLTREFPNIPLILDHLQSIQPCFRDGSRGWTVFNDWLDLAWKRMTMGFGATGFPEGIEYISLDSIRHAVFQLDSTYSNRFHQAH